jgi:ferritin-like metal-binding protein YciE
MSLESLNDFGLLVRTLNEEKATDEKLMELAETMVNEKAMSV